VDAALAVQQGLEARAAWKFPSPAPTSPKKASAAGATYPVARRMTLSERRIVRSLKGDFTNSRAAWLPRVSPPHPRQICYSRLGAMPL